ncbi:MAG: CARDB domain-containing protein [Candidatus Margulisiibacteriota bacterium]
MQKSLFWSILILSLVITASLAVTKPAQKKPDLVVTKIKATNPTKQGNKIFVEYTIKNQGTAASKASAAGITPLTGSKKIQQTTPPLGPGQTTTTTCILDANKKGNFNITVSADYLNSNVELNEANNENTIKFGIGGKF